MDADMDLAADTNSNAHCPAQAFVHVHTLHKCLNWENQFTLQLTYAHPLHQSMSQLGKATCTGAHWHVKSLCTISKIRIKLS